MLTPFDITIKWGALTTIATIMLSIVIYELLDKAVYGFFVSVCSAMHLKKGKTIRTNTFLYNWIVTGLFRTVIVTTITAVIMTAITRKPSVVETEKDVEFYLSITRCASDSFSRVAEIDFEVSRKFLVGNKVFTKGNKYGYTNSEWNMIFGERYGPFWKSVSGMDSMPTDTFFAGPSYSKNPKCWRVGYLDLGLGVTSAVRITEIPKETFEDVCKNPKEQICLEYKKKIAGVDGTRKTMRSDTNRISRTRQLLQIARGVREMCTTKQDLNGRVLRTVTNYNDSVLSGDYHQQYAMYGGEIVLLSYRLQW